MYYSGDLISFEVGAHHGHDWGTANPPDVDLEIWLGEPDGGELIAEGRIPFNGKQEGEIRLVWAWDTTDLVGPQLVSVLLDPDDKIQIGDENDDNNLIIREVDLHPRSEIPTVWANARWVQQESSCCVFHYITGTAAERDIQELMALADKAIAYSAVQLGEETDSIKLDVYLIDRVLGHGGFATGGVIISYLDRYYAGGEMELVFRHEGVHLLDRLFAEVRPALLAEGLAVFVSGGHFREEPLLERAAALLVLDRYIPLSKLAVRFYPSQHEIGYLEAAGFVSYLVDRFGWERFKTFYGDIRKNGQGQVAMIDTALQDHFGLTLDEAEADWLAILRELSVSQAQIADLSLTIQFFDSVRRYQQAWDPSAYFLDVWLPELDDAESQNLTADWMRHPSGEVNVTLEVMFLAADRAIDNAAYPEAEALLDAINKVLDAEGDLMADPLADQYRVLVQVAAGAGYEAQEVALVAEANLAWVLAAEAHTADTFEMIFSRRAGSWRLLSRN